MVSARSIVGIVLLGAYFEAGAGTDPLPIIDMHLHALAADAQGPPPIVICAPYDSMPIRTPGAPVEEYVHSFLKTANCAHPILSAKDNDTLREESLAALQRYNIIAVTSGEPQLVKEWHSADPKRIIPAVMFGINDAPSIASLRTMYKAGMLKVMGEIAAQYDGVGPNDSRLEPYWKLAEELDIPVGVHIGPGPPGAAYLGMTKYRAKLSDPLLLEDVLVRHPRLRLYVMHAGWPMIDRMIALLYAHPQVYVDLAVIDYTQPREEFHRYVQRLVDAGYGKRVMFGSDQMVWPEAIGFAIDGIQSATFLTQEQKRDILHDNAARFLRLTEPPR